MLDSIKCLCQSFLKILVHFFHSNFPFPHIPYLIMIVFVYVPELGAIKAFTTLKFLNVPFPLFFPYAFVFFSAVTITPSRTREFCIMIYSTPVHKYRIGCRSFQPTLLPGWWQLLFLAQLHQSSRKKILFKI